MHRATLQYVLDNFPDVAKTKQNTYVDAVSQNSDTSFLDYCLFRRSFDCSYNFNVVYMKREIAHSLIPKESRVDGYFVNVPVFHPTEKHIRVHATPFSYTIENQ